MRDKLGQVEGPRALTYVLRYTVTDAIAPAWSIPRGEQDPQGNLQYPRKRLRELIPIWREGLEKPRSRYLLDYQYDMPPPSTDGTRIQLQLYWDDGWSPVHTITGDTIAKEIDRSIGYNDRWRVTHLFDYHRDGVPPAIDLRPHKIRLASILGFPIAAAILWLLFLLRELFRRGEAPAVAEVNEQYVRETVYSEPPEVIAARWSARATYPNLEAFLRRLEREHKIALTIEPRTVTFDGEEMEDDPLVKIRLLVPREELSAYERAGIDALIPTGWEVTSDEIQKQHEEQGFDPTEAMQAELARIAKESGSEVKPPWYSRMTSIGMFAGGLWLALMEAATENREPVHLFAALAGGILLNILWPSTISRHLIRLSLLGTLLLLVPIVLATIAIAIIHLVCDVPLGVLGSIGVSLTFLGAYQMILSSCATRATTEAIERQMKLARARRWLRNELKSATPRLRDEHIPHLNALGLDWTLARWRKRHQRPESRFATSQFTGNAPPEVEEEWGGVLFT